jgi:hypothetical protein
MTLEGKKTYSFLAIALLGYLGLSDLITEAEVAASIDNVAQLVGILGAVWGRYVAKV